MNVAVMILRLHCFWQLVQGARIGLAIILHLQVYTVFIRSIQCTFIGLYGVHTVYTVYSYRSIRCTNGVIHL